MHRPPADPGTMGGGCGVAAAGAGCSGGVTAGTGCSNDGCGVPVAVRACMHVYRRVYIGIYECIFTCMTYAYTCVCMWMHVCTCVCIVLYVDACHVPMAVIHGKLGHSCLRVCTDLRVIPMRRTAALVGPSWAVAAQLMPQRVSADRAMRVPGLWLGVHMLIFIYVCWYW